MNSATIKAEAARIAAKITPAIKAGLKKSSPKPTAKNIEAYIGKAIDRAFDAVMSEKAATSQKKALDNAVAGVDLTRQLNPLDALLADEEMRRAHIRNLFADRKDARDAWMAVRHGTTAFANNRRVELENELKEINKNLEASGSIYVRDCDKILALLDVDMATAKAAGATDAELAVIDAEIKRIRALKILTVRE